MSTRRSADIFTAFAIGIGIGAVAGILFAPQSGEETRDYILKGARDGFDGAVDTGKEYARRTQEGVNQAKEYARNAVETGKGYVRKAQEGIGQAKEQATEQVKEQVKTHVANAAEVADRTYHQVSDAAEAADRAYHKAKGA